MSSSIFTNKARAERANEALDVYIGDDEAEDDHYMDIITDLMHAMRARGLNPYEMIGHATEHFEEEEQEEKEQV